MFKFMILFYDPQHNLNEFEKGYARFLGMVEQIPHITRRQVVHVIGSPSGASPYYRILELYFTDEATMQTALNSEAGQIVGSALHQAFLPRNFRFETAFAEVYEENGGTTPTDSVLSS